MGILIGFFRLFFVLASLINGRLQSNAITHRFASGSPSNRKTNDDAEFDPNQPIPFFGTAAHLSAGPRAEAYKPKHKYHPFVVMFSLATFLIYFCVLREENSTDEVFNKDLFDYFGENGEATVLKNAYAYNIKHNLPVTEIVRRLRDIGAPIPPGYAPERKKPYA